MVLKKTMKRNFPATQFYRDLDQFVEKRMNPIVRNGTKNYRGLIVEGGSGIYPS